jgi:hypothetical protein
VCRVYQITAYSNQDASNFYGTLDSKAINTNPGLQLSSSLFNGLSFHLKNENKNASLQTISKMPGVKNIWPMRTYTRPKPILHGTGNVVNGNLMKLAKRDSANNVDSAHQMGQVDRLRNAGFTGKGIKIGLVDDGVSVKINFTLSRN